MADAYMSIFVRMTIYYLSSCYSHMSISQFAQQVNHPLCEYMDSIPYHKANTGKARLGFLSGDPTVYGNDSFRMPQQGYDIVKKNIHNVENHGYTLSTGVPSARQAVAKLYNPKTAITDAQVVIQHGVNQGLLSALIAFTNQGDEILVPEIGYPIFQKLAPALGVAVKHYKLKIEDNFSIDLEHAASLVTDRTQFLFVINPSNPMGTVFSKSHMQEILAFCDHHQLPLVADEVYHRQVFAGVEFHSFGDVTVDVPVIVLCGVEKLLSVPGWCTSWTVIFDKHGYLVKVWHNILTNCATFLHSNKFTQVALPEILEKVGIFTASKVQAVQPVHDDLCSKFSEMKGYKPIKANGTIYLTVQIDPSSFKDIKNDIQLVNALLEEENIAVLPLSIFGGSLQGLRFLTCGKPELYSELFSRLHEFNSRHQ